MSHSSPSANDDLLAEIAAEFTDRLRHGEKPTPVEYQQRYPAMAEPVRSLLETVELLELARRELRRADARMADSRLPERLGDCLILKEIGRGGMGIVCAAEQPKLGRHVAVKFLLPELAADTEARERFLHEARAAAKVVTPYVVTIHAVGEQDDTPYLVMELIKGISLREHLATWGPLAIAEIVQIAVGIAEGLAVAHQQRVIHRDVKPANILLEHGTQQVKLTDFGLARLAEGAAITRKGDIAGTPRYMSPEQVNSQPVDHRSDLFSLGTVIYEMCCGRPPFATDSIAATLRQVADQPAEPLVNHRPDLPLELIAIVERLMAKSAQDRYESAADVAAVLRRALIGPNEAVVPSPATLPTSFPHRRRRRRAVTSTIAVTGLALLTWSFYPRDSVRRPNSDAVALPIESTTAVLQFNGQSSYVMIPTLHKDDRGPDTVEAWVQCPMNQSAMTASAVVVLGGDVRCQINLLPHGWETWDVFLESPNIESAESDMIRPLEWVHLAYVRDAVKASFYINGQHIGTSKRTSEPAGDEWNPVRESWLGGHRDSRGEYRFFFEGLIAEVRFSNVARYSTNFTPQTRFESDAHTLALFHCDEGTGDQLHDSSGNQHHGQLVQATWNRSTRPQSR